MTPAQRWLASLWPFVRAELPAAPARVLEIGCGPFGGFVPGLLHGGYEAVGIDRNAPEAAGYQRSDFEQYEPPEPVDAIVASRSLHHVGDLEDVLRRAADALRPGGVADRRRMGVGAVRRRHRALVLRPPRPRGAGLAAAAQGRAGRRRARPGRTTSRPGRGATACTAATGSSARSMRASSGGRARTAPTSSPISPASPRATSSGRSMRARFAPTASATWEPAAPESDDQGRPRRCSARATLIASDV